MSDQLALKRDEDDAITRAVNQKVEEWTERIKQRDQENAEQARTINSLKSKLASASLGLDRLKVEKLTKVSKNSLTYGST